jgi:hypothetical protein
MTESPDGYQRVTLLSFCARRSEHTEADWAEVASVDPTEARNAIR